MLGRLETTDLDDAMQFFKSISIASPEVHMKLTSYSRIMDLGFYNQPPANMDTLTNPTQNASSSYV